jgi:hypothetical protein
MRVDRVALNWVPEGQGFLALDQDGSVILF